MMRRVGYLLVTTEAPEAALQVNMEGVCPVVARNRSAVWEVNESMAWSSTIAIAHPAKPAPVMDAPKHPGDA